jgi:ADP-ribose pyrophosphatase YjhB (NUDIX family)
MKQKIDYSKELSVKQTYLILGNEEKRHVSKIKVNPMIIQTIFNNIGNSQISFNLMIMTTDDKVLLLERTQSHHFTKVIHDLKLNVINFKLWKSLYTSELENIFQMFFGFMPPRKIYSSFINNTVHIFPGGHPNKRETIISTLLRELREETCMNIPVKDLKFNQSSIFNVSIYDLIIRKSFTNFVFPVKINMSSKDILQNFKETKHTRNPTFVDITGHTLFDAFILVQKFMVL